MHNEDYTVSGTVYSIQKEWPLQIGSILFHVYKWVAGFQGKK